MIKSIWQNKGLDCMGQLGVWSLLIMRMFYMDKESVVSLCVWIFVVLVIFIGVVIEITISVRLKKINNFIYKDCRYIKISREACEITSETTQNITQYFIIYKFIEDENTYTLKHICMVNKSNKREFESILNTLTEFIFVCSNKNPCYNYLELNDNMKCLDMNDSYAGWRKDRRALLFVMIFLGEVIEGGYYWLI